MTKWRRFKLSLIRSWEDLHHIYACSSSSAFHFQDYRNFFLLPLTLSILHFTAFRIPVTFHPRRWPLASPRRPASRNLSLNSNRLDLALSRRADVRLRAHGLSSPLSSTSHSLASASIWRISWLRSTTLCSSTCA